MNPGCGHCKSSVSSFFQARGRTFSPSGLTVKNDDDGYYYTLSLHSELDGLMARDDMHMLLFASVLLVNHDNLHVIHFMF